jgi:hypothetical protein
MRQEKTWMCGECCGDFCLELQVKLHQAERAASPRQAFRSNHVTLTSTPFSYLAILPSNKLILQSGL